MLTGDEERKFIENNKKITELLKENEMILRRSGYNPPLTNYTLEQSEKIGVPSGYIRTVAAFNKKYHLQEICIKRTIRHNITYALETSDLLNFIINRINIWGSVEAIFFKLSIVNFVSVKVIVGEWLEHREYRLKPICEHGRYRGQGYPEHILHYMFCRYYGTGLHLTHDTSKKRWIYG